MPRALPSHTNARYIIGCMSGTSLDGLDLAIVRITGRGLEMRAALLSHGSARLGSLAKPLMQLAGQQPMAAADIARLSHGFARLHAKACTRLWQRTGQKIPLPPSPSLISVHGQTVFHRPPFSWQLFAPTLLAREMRCSVVCDLRGADLAAGGQGAPLTPLADTILYRKCFRQSARHRGGSSFTIVNLGGFCNYTFADPTASNPSNRLLGGDICACNLLLNEIAQVGWSAAFDSGGKVALTGKITPSIVERFHKLLDRQRRLKSSLGTDHTAAACVAKELQLAAPADVAASACEAIAKTIAAAVLKVQRPGRVASGTLNAVRMQVASLQSPAHDARVVLAGGGSKHRFLVARIAALLGQEVLLSDSCGVPAQSREAACWAVLGALAEDGVAVGAAGITGATNAECVRPGVWVFAG